MAQHFMSSMPPKLTVDDVPNKKYSYLFKDGPQPANFLVNNLLDERDKFVTKHENLEAEVKKLIKINTWEAGSLPPAQRYMLQNGPTDSAQFVKYLFNTILRQEGILKKIKGDADADIKLKVEKIADLEREADEIQAPNKEHDQQVKTMQARHNTTVNNLRSEKKLLSDENAEYLKVVAREQITKNQLQAGNAQKDEQIQQLQERIQVLEQQPQVEQKTDQSQQELEGLREEIGGLREEIGGLREENEQLSECIMRDDNGFIMTPELYEVDRIMASEGTVLMTQHNVRVTQQTVMDLEDDLDKEKKENKARQEEVINIQAQLIAEPDGTIVKQEDYDALQESLRGSKMQCINMATEQIKKIQENQGLKKKLTITKARLITEPDGTIAKQEDFDALNETNIGLNETNRLFTTQVIAMANEHYKKVQEAEANNIYHEGARVTQEQFKDTLSAASQAARHDNGDIVTQQQWIDTQAKVSQAAINEDGTLVTNEQVQNLDSQIIRKSDGSVATIEEVRELEAQVNTLSTQLKDLDANLVRDDSGAIMTRAEIKQQWDEETAHIKDSKDFAEKNCLVMDNLITDLKAEAMDSQKKQIALVTEAEEAKEGRDVAEKKCVALDKDVADLKAQAIDFQKKETNMVSEVQEAKEGRGAAEKKCLAIDKDNAELQAQAKDARKKEIDLVSEVQEAKEGRDVAEKKCLTIDKDNAELRAQAKDARKKEINLVSEVQEAKEGRDVAEKKCLTSEKDIAELQAQAKDARKKETDLVSEAREAEKSKTVAEKKCLATDKDVANMKTELIEAQKAKDSAEKKLSEMEKNASTPNPKRKNGTIVDQQGYEDEAKIRSDAIAYLQRIITEGKAKIAALEVSKEEVEGEKTRLTAELENAKDKDVDLKKSKLDDQEEITRLTEELSSAKVEISKFEATPSDLAAENARLEEAFNRLQDIYKQQGRELEHVETSHGDLETEHKELKDLKQGMLKQIESLQHEVKQVLEKLGKLEQEHSPCGEVKSDLINLQSKFSKLEKQLDGKDKELEKASKDSDDISELKKKILEDQNTVITELKQALTQLSESKEDNQILATGKAQVEANLEEVTQESAGLMKAMNGLRDDITSLEIEFEGLEIENGVLRLKLQKKAGPSDPKALIPEPFPVTYSAAPKASLDSIAEEDEDDQGAIAGEEPLASTPTLPTVVDDASYEKDEAGVPVLPHATGTATGNSEEEHTGPGAPEEPVASTPILPTILDDASFKNGEVDAPVLTAAANSNGEETASGAPLTIVPHQNHNQRPSATSGLGWKVNGLLWLLLLLLFFGVSLGVSWWRRTELLGRGDDLARLALISLRAGGGTGTAWPAWLYDDEVAEIVGGFYG